MIAVFFAAMVAASPPQALRFVEDGQARRTLDLAALTKVAPAETITVFDPYYQRQKHFRAVPLLPVLAAGFGGRDLRREEVLLRAQDGYTVPIAGARLYEGGAYLAFRDEDVPGWEPIGPQHADPAPFYLVWTRPGQDKLETHPRPWALQTIEVTRFEKAFPHVPPTGGGAQVKHGFAVFRAECIKCHAINREGGHVGPDLNVPQNIFEYRPEAQIRAYIRDPQQFRYSAMPAHPDMSDEDLDALLAYLRQKRGEKFDSGKKQ